ncbi:hypothetical protein VM95_33335 [Streptomyces rubellomurinus]|uniref:Uncharacterized protein n=1 Tax=Streptomyces rubellomurinus (strain ATCC 31215) TaxID=359131 RepID=A0A0F2T5E7_STRR3|nr:hypothetical protein VM95_33335 [Streptomyces rubellomurinus]
MRRAGRAASCAPGGSGARPPPSASGRAGPAAGRGPGRPGCCRERATGRPGERVHALRPRPGAGAVRRGSRGTAWPRPLGPLRSRNPPPVLSI